MLIKISAKWSQNILIDCKAIAGDYKGNQVLSEALLEIDYPNS